MKQQFIDIHAHLDICKNTNEVIKKAKEKSVLIVVAGLDHKSNASLFNLSKGKENIQICMGIYPTEAEKLDDKQVEKEISFIKENKDKIIGIGEVGLDNLEGEDLDKQKKVLGKFINLAKDLDKPLIVHSRKAEAETIEFLERFFYKKIIMHCFSGSMKLVKRIIENGWNLSIPTNVVYSEHFQKIVELTPIKNLFCETDSPFLNPYKSEEFHNEPANVIESYKKIAEIKGISLDEVKNQIFENFERVFGIPSRN